MNEKTKQQLKKFLVLGLSVLALVYIVYQVYLATHEPVRTEVVRQATVNDTVDADTFVVRNESYLTADSDGTIIPLTSSGSRVAAGEGVVAIFDSESEAADYAEMVTVKEDLNRYSRLNKQKTGTAVNLSTMTGQVSDNVMELAALVDSGDLTDMQEKVYDVRDLIIAKQLATGENLNLDSKVTELESRYAVLTKKTAGYNTVVSEVAGYYIDHTDGFENAVAYEQVADLKPKDIQKLLKQEPDDVPDSVLGKVSSDFDWYMVCVLDQDKAKNLKKGNDVEILLPHSAVTSVKASVYHKSKADGDGQVAVTFQCNRMDAYIASLRKEEAQIVIKSYTGLKIPTEAVRENEDGEKGVYVLEGNIAQFKKLRSVYTEDDFLISSETAEEGETGSYVKLYDAVIMGGKDIYDGKILN